MEVDEYMRNKQVFIQCLFLAGILIICGCGQTAQKPAPDTNPNPGIQQTTDAEKRTMASRFSTLAMEVEGVEKATVVVASKPDTTGVSVDPMSGQPNNSSDVTPPGQSANPEQGNLVAMVGIILNQTAVQNPNQVNSITEQIRNKIKSDNNTIREVLVTTDPNLVKKLQDVAAGIIQGQPVQSYTQDINALDKSLRNQ